jgi:hypothetical protein
LRKGKGGGRWRILRCTACKDEFSERKGTPLWRSRMPSDKALAIASHLKEGCGIRQTARLVGASKDGVTAVALRLGLHAKRFHDQHAQGLTVDEVQFDEKWAFVEKKQKRCDLESAADQHKGDQWDFTAVDVPSRFLVSLVIGKRTRDNLKGGVNDFAERTGGKAPALSTSDDCAMYDQVLLEQYGDLVVPPTTGLPGRPAKPYLKWPEKAVYATVCKTFKRGEVHTIRRELVYGAEEDLQAALEASPVSQTINTAIVERQNGTDRTYNARKVRETYRFSKSLLVHIAVSCWVTVCYNFHHLHRGLRQSLPTGKFLHRTPAMAIGLVDRPLSVAELLTTQVVVPRSTGPVALSHFRRSHTLGPAP